MTFTTIFEATPSQELLGWFPVLGLAYVFVGVLLVVKPGLLNWVFPRFAGSWRKPLSWTWLIFWSIWTVGTFQPKTTQWQADSQNEPFTVVEGRVTDFVRKPYNGPSNETFVVAGRQFSFSEFGLKPSPAQGLITEGVYARVTFRERPVNRIDIFRLEVADPN